MRRLAAGYGALLYAVVVAGPGSFARIAKWWTTENTNARNGRRNR